MRWFKRREPDPKPVHYCGFPPRGQLHRCECGKTWLAVHATGVYTDEWRDVTDTAIGRVWRDDVAAGDTSRWAEIEAAEWQPPRSGLLGEWATEQDETNERGQQ